MTTNAQKEPPKGNLAMLAGLFPFLAPYKRQFALAGIALIIAAASTLAIPYAFKQMIDLGFGAAGTKSTEHIDLYFIALFGVAAETGVVMLIYLDLACKDRGVGSGEWDLGVLHEAIVEGAADRLRPKMMTVLAIMAGLLPIMWGSGAGGTVMRRIAAPMIGGMVSSTILTLLVIPAIYLLWRRAELRRAEVTHL